MGKIGKIIVTVGAFAVAISAIPTTSVQAVKGETWTAPLDGQDYLWGLDPVATSFGTTNTDMAAWSSPGDGWSYLLGTDIKVKTEGDTLTIQGSGELPDYNIFTIDQRPWADSTCSTLIIDDSITYIGSYSFYGMENIKYIFIGSKTFVNDSTCFEGISDNPVVRILGTMMTTRKFGTITVTSMDSIKRLAQNKGGAASFILDTDEDAKDFQQSTNPTLSNVFSAQDVSTPWNTQDKYVSGALGTPICTIVSHDLDSTYSLSAQQVYPENEGYEAYAAYIGDYKIAMTFNVALSKSGEIINQTDKEIQYTLTIPSDFRLQGRTFKLLAAGQGMVYTYDDLDLNDDTITFLTDKPTTAYALIYK
jgi:hypothetical protein